MSSKVAVVLFAMIIAITCSHNVPSRRIWSRHKRDAPNIVIGNMDNQIRNNFIISGNGSIPSGSKIVAGSVLTQANNDFVAITDTGKLILVMPDVLIQPEPPIIPELNDTETRNLLNLTPNQHNAMVIINLRKSLAILEEYCERLSQLVDQKIIERKNFSENPKESFLMQHSEEQMWYDKLIFYWNDVFSYQKRLNLLMNKIRVQDSIFDLDVSKMRGRMIKLLRTYKLLTKQSQKILNYPSEN